MFLEVACEITRICYYNYYDQGAQFIIRTTSIIIIFFKKQARAKTLGPAPGCLIASLKFHFLKNV